MRWMRRSLYIVLALLVLLVIGVFVAADSSTVNQWAIRYFANKVPGLSIQGSSGSLLKGLEFQTIKYSTQQQDIEIKHAKIALSPRCLLHSQLCVTRLTAAGIDVVIPSNQSATSKDESSGTSVWTPFWPIHLKNIDLRHTHLMVDGHDIQWQKLSLNASWVKHHIQINTLNVQGWRYQGNAGLTSSSTHSKNMPTALVPSKLKDSLTDYLHQLQLPYLIDIKHLQLKNGQLNLAQSIAIDNASLHGSWDSQQLNITQLAIDSSLGSIQGKLKQQFIPPYQSEFNFKAYRHNVGHVAMQGAGPASALKMNVIYQGKANATLTGHLNWRSRSLPYALQLQIDSSDEVLTPIKKVQAKLDVHGSLTGYQGQLHSRLTSIQSLTIESSFKGNYRQIPQFSLTAKSGSGLLQANGQLRWSPQLMVRSKVNIHQLDLSAWAGQSLPLINGLVNTSFINQQWTIDSDKLSGTWLSNPWSIALHIKGENSHVNQLKVNAKLANNELLVKGAVDQNVALSGTLNFNNLSAFPGVDAGQLHGKFAVSGLRLSPWISWHIKGHNWKMSQYDMKLGTFRSSARLRLAKDLPGRMSLAIRNANYQKYQNISAVLDYRHSANEHQLLTVLLKNPKQSLALDVSGQGTFNQWQGKLNKLTVRSLVGSFNLQKPTPIALSEQQLHLSPLCLKQRLSGSICLTQPAVFGTDQLALHGKIQQFQLAPLASVWLNNLIWDGRLNGQFSVTRNRLKPLATSVELSSKNGQLIQTVSSGESVKYRYQNLFLNADISAGKAKLALKEKSQQLGDSQASVQIGLAKNQHYPLQGEVILSNLKLAPYTSLMGSLSRLNGLVNGRLQIAGELNNPDLSGNFSITDGQVAGPNLPLAVDNLSSQIKLAHQQAYMTGSFLSQGHKATWHGSVRWPNGELSGQLALKGNHLSVHYPPANLVVSPDIKLAVDRDNLQVQGTLNINKGTIKVNKLPQQATSLSSDVTIVDAQQKRVAARALNMDVTVDLGNALYLDAFGLTTQLVGKLNVQQTSGKAIQTTGQIDLQDGKFTAYGQHLEIQSGTLTFSGPTNSPMIDVKAIRDPQRTNDDVTVGVIASGTPKQLTVNLFSDPSMAQNEQLSYLLRGHGITNDSDSSALTSLLLSTGLNQTGQLVTKLGNRVGIKQLSLSTSGSGDATQVQVSGYLLPGVQLKYGHGMFEASNEITLRYQLIPKFYLEVVSGLENAIDLYYEFSTN
ncbi:translocation/assembly module TamB domain-containing protein [Celerinatantimonas diazotrophica]|uniref:Autotransporter secretion inner membrane protein TamB n=1 Tax=Celerinatantimonas diazotrophica TaxID=412034 RepID=A0A4R1KGS6_9GAMM|nr:translocation/assembly module TamB domain-containing protein [Celerinatantimonas diazotrophica]TCK63955.1 autotransporter secretion inner membrane protein TamB [Celerinatantimonas diazotrophica]CAG9297040.1 Translocation and assembly module subunit TamB [Celerinatantimonas diazotrophica]